MPANLPPQYYELEREYKQERDPREKLRLAEELLRMMPKHKGTDKLQADMKAKIAKLKKLVGGEQQVHGARQASTHDYIQKEGAAQIIFIGPPNAGKSSLIDELTEAKPEVAAYPYTTREPLPGMAEFETLHFQLIDTPPISSESFETYLANLVRNADLVILVADLAAPSMAEDIKTVLTRLDERRIVLMPRVESEPDDPRYCYKTTVVCAHKMLDDEGGQNLRQLTEQMAGFTVVPTSIIDEGSLRALMQAAFTALGVMRVYTKHAGEEVALVDPVVLPIGSTVQEAANSIHKDFAQKLKFARVWGEGKHDGQRVQLDFHLSDRDIIEFHI